MAVMPLEMRRTKGLLEGDKGMPNAQGSFLDFVFDKMKEGRKTRDNAMSRPWEGRQGYYAEPNESINQSGNHPVESGNRPLIGAGADLRSGYGTGADRDNEPSPPFGGLPPRRTSDNRLRTGTGVGKEGLAEPEKTVAPGVGEDPRQYMETFLRGALNDLVRRKRWGY